MKTRSRIALVSSVITLSCTRASAPTPTATSAAPVSSPRPATATTGSGTATPAGRGGSAGAAAQPAGAGGRGAPMTPEMRAARRDSLARLRTDAVAQLMRTIAGRENEPAAVVFKNVTLMKDVPAGRFLVMMDSTFGRALSMNCTSCHTATDWADDTRPNKGRTRIMIELTNAINSQHLTKMPAGRGGNTPTITCITCHRGNGNPGTAILP